MGLDSVGALKQYLSSGYMVINSTLRMQDKYFSKPKIDDAGGPDEVLARIGLLTTSLLRQPAYNNDRGYVLRGWNCTDSVFKKRFVVNGEFVDRAFLSTGAGESPFSPKTNKTFILMKIKIPRGGHPGKKVPEGAVGAFAGEDEVLFPPYSTFKVLEARKSKDEDNNLVHKDLHGKFEYFALLEAQHLNYMEGNFKDAQWYKQSAEWLQRMYK